MNQTQSMTQNPSSNLNSVHGIVLQKNQLEHKLKFGSLPSEIAIVPEGSPKVDASNSNNLMNRSRQVNSNSSSIAVRNAPPPGFSSKPRRMGLDPNAGGENSSSGNLTRTRDVLAENVGIRGDSSRGLGLSAQLDRPGPPSGSNLRSVKASDVEDSMMKLENAAVEDGVSNEIDDLGQRLVDSLLVEDESDDKNEAKQHKNHREKDSRSDSRGQRLLNQRMRAYKRQMRCRVDIDRLNDAFITIVKSLIPAEEEKAKQQQLLTLLEKLIIKEWPTARLYLYGSCANSFGVSKSDVDLCLVMEDTDINKADVLLKLADILQSDNLQNVQALTRARVPIVKLMDPATGISCDICINNVLAVVNTRLLRDYARIDMRLRHLAFIVKHWAKSRGVNETYQGTLSSYAYVLMCIHFLQQRRPAILPCLQGMEATYSVTVDNIECAYFDQVEKLRDFGLHNKETVSQLVWGFFNYWAYRHDYTDSVISVRTGSIISKREKDWTRRIGNDRHLICIEDPFETSHDLGRVVDKHSIRVLREEFERAAEIMQFDPNPCVTLFEPYVPS